MVVSLVQQRYGVSVRNGAADQPTIRWGGAFDLHGVACGLPLLWQRRRLSVSSESKLESRSQTAPSSCRPEVVVNAPSKLIAQHNAWTSRNVCVLDPSFSALLLYSFAHQGPV